MSLVSGWRSSRWKSTRHRENELKNKKFDTSRAIEHCDVPRGIDITCPLSVYATTHDALIQSTFPDNASSARRMFKSLCIPKSASSLTKIPSKSVSAL